MVSERCDECGFSGDAWTDDEAVSDEARRAAPETRRQSDVGRGQSRTARTQESAKVAAA